MSGLGTSISRGRVLFGRRGARRRAHDRSRDHRAGRHGRHFRGPRRPLDVVVGGDRPGRDGYLLPDDGGRASGELDRRGAFYDILTDYTEALIGFIMQSTACNAVHTVEQRLARWLLMAHDRMESDDFPLTQEFAAMMLGATRPTVSIVAGTLQHAGLITYFRGQVTDPEPQTA